MIFQAHSEVHLSVVEPFEEADSTLRFALRRVFQSGPLAEIDWTFRYVPIVMPSRHLSVFPPRACCNSNNRTILHAPVLRYDIFAHGDEHDWLLDYANGLQRGASLFHEAGLERRAQAAFAFGIKSITEEIDALFAVGA